MKKTLIIFGATLVGFVCGIVVVPFVKKQPLTRLNEYCNSGDSPLKFDPRLGEYQLVFKRVIEGRTQTVVAPIEFCPWTGQKLPPAKRDSDFVPAASRDEKAEWQKLARSITNLQRAVSVLGVPTECIGTQDGIRTQMVFASRFKSIDVVIQQTTNGTIRTFTVPK